MRAILALVLLCVGAFALADGEMRDVKTANPFILLHPASGYVATA